ncbi:hypothetical protein EAF00_001117 [Botryotinia globosa]|nr:hypothetical protein EAF00_001117 [Botryotinia globosa]
MSETKTAPVKEPIVPTQMMSKTAALYQELTGDFSIDAVKHTISHFLPPFTADAITGITIKASDRNRYMIDRCREFATAENWPVEASVMHAQSLTFPDHYFTYSFSKNFISHLDDTHDPAAKQVYRTLKSEGIAIVSTWAAMAHREPIKRAHLETRGPDVSFPIALPTHWYGKDALRNFYIVGGFKGEDIKITTCNIYIEAKDSRHLISPTWSFLGVRADG